MADPVDTPPRRRKLLVASVGVATVSYALVATACGKDNVPVTGNLPAPPPPSAVPISGNLPAPPPVDSTPPAGSASAPAASSAPSNQPKK